jgi:hypothetical protein
VIAGSLWVIDPTNRISHCSWSKGPRFPDPVEVQGSHLIINRPPGFKLLQTTRNHMESRCWSVLCHVVIPAPFLATRQFQPRLSRIQAIHVVPREDPAVTSQEDSYQVHWAPGLQRDPLLSFVVFLCFISLKGTRKPCFWNVLACMRFRARFIINYWQWNGRAMKALEFRSDLRAQVSKPSRPPISSGGNHFVCTCKTRTTRHQLDRVRHGAATSALW